VSTLYHLSDPSRVVQMPGAPYVHRVPRVLMHRFAQTTGWTWQEAFRRGFRVRAAAPADA